MELSQDTEHIGNEIRKRQTQSVTIDLNKYPILPGILKIPRSGEGFFKILIYFNWRLITLSILENVPCIPEKRVKFTVLE